MNTKKTFTLTSKGLANNVTLPIKPEKQVSRNDDFTVQLLPFKRKYDITINVREFPADVNKKM